MANFQTKNSTLFVKKESTEGTPVFPAAGTDAIALQDGFTLEPGFEVLESAELTGTIGASKNVKGIENPTASISHYIRHSGVEGTEPNFGELIEAAFGSVEVNATEFDTIGGSTAGTSSSAATLVVDTAEGANFSVGEAVLIKDGTSTGFAVRNVESISSDTLTLNFNLDGAPASGVNLGKAIFYSPADKDHPTLTLTNFRGNGAAIEQIAGARVTELGIEFPAGDFINGTFSFEGLQYNFNPIEVAGNNKLDFDIGGGEITAAITAKTYRTPTDLATAIETAMDAVSGDDITVIYTDAICDDDVGKFVISTAGGSLSLLWLTGTNTNTSIGQTIGFDTSADDTGSTSYTADNKITLTRTFTPSLDSENPLVAKNNVIFLGDFNDNCCFSTQSLTFTLTDTNTPVLDVCAETGKSAALITERAVTVSILANIPEHDVDKFDRLRNSTTTKMMYNAGRKDGAGNFIAGSVANIYMKTATIETFELTDTDGLVTLEMELSGFVDSGLAEVFLNFL